MLEIQTLARPYAKAAVLFAKEKNKGLEQWQNYLSCSTELLQVESVQSMVGSPSVPLATKQKVFCELLTKLVAGSSLPQPFANFIALLFENRKIELLPVIKEQFDEMKFEEEQVLKAELISAFPVDTEQKKAFEAALAKRFGKKIILTIKEDGSLIGGAVIRTDDFVIDGSVRSQLTKLNHSLMS